MSATGKSCTAATIDQKFLKRHRPHAEDRLSRRRHAWAMADVLSPPREQFLREEVVRGGMDLLFFANTRNLRRADEMLASHGLGRAHHRVLYFVARRPGISVSGLLAILSVTKQSLGRVSNELQSRKLIQYERGVVDGRLRLLSLTPAGAELERQIFTDLHDNVARAYTASGGEAVAGFWTVLQHLIGDEGRTQFRAVQSFEETADARGPR